MELDPQETERETFYIKREKVRKDDPLLNPSILIQI